MAKLRAPRNRERGNSLVLAMIVMSALATLGSLTVVSVQGSLKASTADRTAKIALYAAESGAATAMAFLRQQDLWLQWTSWQPNHLIMLPFPSNGALPGDPNNLFNPDQHAYYKVMMFNDPYEHLQQDHDYRVIIESTGYGPQNSTTVIDWEVQATNTATTAPHGSFILIGWHIVM